MKIKGNFELALQEVKNDKNNAIATVNESKNTHFGVLANCVYTLKDNYAQKGFYTKGSSLILDNFKANYDSTIVSLLNQAAASCVARTNLDEFGLGGSGEYSAFGLIKNPLNEDYLVGGSSSGAAATFTKNISFAIGSDTGDSVRKPASNIGCVGFKPSYGAISRYGLFAFATSLDTVAYFTHNVNDAITLSSVLYQQDLKHDLSSIDLSFDSKTVQKVKPNKVAYLDCFSELEDSVAKSYKQVLDKLKNQGVELVKITPEEHILKSIDVVYKIIAFSEASSNLANLTGVEFGNRLDGKNWEDIYINTRSHGLGKMVQSRLILGAYFLKLEHQIKYFVQAKKMRRYIANYFTKIHQSADLFIYPASNNSAPKIGENYKASYMDYILTNANLTGNPSLTLKMGEDQNNMPFNLALDGELYKDTKLFSHALYIEEDILGGNNE
ncbi:Asp-tRNA(Asn)/Glu-tRNA(Gln) amidotransferase subunit GatA [[Mycoplasma] falconis]|uniref:Asp-tRNA(Asn)/Glu-tRNA(Gln) amidotransferase subunit GatA n=1 Tax=[Mycoplasma] falconis TaxID=92403 RepID=A0A501XBZ8_9BACT|nr:amidase family protein [[Mycoplasma] falconis]TPE58081.1 Asp-tRNA(Asn)/Glu-tRNA(Gln) amidotransferase subunit GatA [[Mycoplasma] falconis]